MHERAFSVRRIAVFLLCAAALAAGGAEPVPTLFKSTRRETHWWQRQRPAKPSPASQLEYAGSLQDAGQLRRAAKAYRALVNAWPESAEAPAAQLAYARLLERRGRAREAFDEYQFLVRAYAGFFPYDDVMERLYAIADGVATRERSFLGIRFRTPEDAIPLFEILIQNGIQWKRAAELQFRIARIYEHSRQYDLAMDAYGAYYQRYSVSPLAEQALYGQALCSYRLARQYPVAADLQENAAAALQGFIDWYPYSEMTAAARECLADLQHTLAGQLYSQAGLYEKTARFVGNPEQRRTRVQAARMAYARVIDEYPASPWADRAHARLKVLHPTLEVVP